MNAFQQAISKGVIEHFAENREDGYGSIIWNFLRTASFQYWRKWNEKITLQVSHMTNIKYKYMTNIKYS